MFKMKLLSCMTVMLVAICFQANALRRNETNIDNNALLIKFLDLHRYHCGEAATCGSSEHVEPSEFLIPVPCCIPCSCLPSCAEQQNCCPVSVNGTLTVPMTTSGLDNIGLEIGTNMSKDELILDRKDIVSLNETDDNKTDIDELDKLRIENSTHITKDSEGLDMNVFDITNENCMRPQALYYPNRFLDSQAYMMVVHCPDEFRDKMTIDKCNAGMDGAALLDMIPVTSKLSGLTYKNKHCLMCNEKLQAENFIEWRVEIVSSGVQREHLFFSSPDLIVDALTQKKMAFSNVHFISGDESLTRPCKAFDIISCNETGLWDIYNEEMEALCLDGYQLPIISRIGEKPFTFKTKHVSSATQEVNSEKRDFPVNTG